MGAGKLSDLARQQLGQELFDDELVSIFDIGTTLGSELSKFAIAVDGSFTTGFVFSILVFIFQTWYGMRSFKKQVLAARRGKMDWDPKRAKMADAANYVGLTISNAIIIFFFVTIIITLVVLAFAWHITRAIIFHPDLWKNFLIPMIVPIVVNIILKKIFVYKIITSQSKPMGDRLLLRRAFHAYDLVMVVFRLFTGPITALVRAIMGFGVALITLPFMDRSPIPGWVERYLLLDMGSQAFHAMILMHSRLSNPVMNVAIELWSHATFRRINDQNAAVPLRHESALGKEDNAGVASTDDWIGDDRYAAGHRLYVELTSHALRPFTPKEQWVETRGGRKGLGPMRWHLAVMLIRCPWLRRYRYFGGDRYKKKTKHGGGGDDESKEEGGIGASKAFNKNMAVQPTDSTKTGSIDVEKEDLHRDAALAV